MQRFEIDLYAAYVKYALQLISLSYDMRRYGPGSARSLLRHPRVRKQERFIKRDPVFSHPRQVWQGRQIIRGALNPGVRSRPVGSRR